MCCTKVVQIHNNIGTASPLAAGPGSWQAADVVVDVGLVVQDSGREMAGCVGVSGRSPISEILLTQHRHLVHTQCGSSGACWCTCSSTHHQLCVMDSERTVGSVQHVVCVVWTV